MFSQGAVFGFPYRVAAAIVVMSAMALIGYSAAWTDAPVLDGDSAQYLAVAQDLADGRLDALHFRTPGYPLLLTLTGSIYEPTRALFRVSLLLHLASVWMLAAALLRAGAGASWVLALASLLLLPPYVEPAAYVMTENLAQFALVGGFTSLVLWHQKRSVRWAVVAGIALSFSALVRPIYQALAPLLCVALLLLPVVARSARAMRAEAARAAVGLFVAWVGIVGGFAAYNHARFQWFGVTPSAGLHLSTKTMGFVERLPDEYAAVREIFIRERNAQLIRRGGTHTGTQTIWAVRAELEDATGLSQPELSTFLVGMNLALIRRAPMEYLQEVVRSFAVYWFPAAGRLAAMDSAALRWLWVALHGALVLLFALQLAALAGLGAMAITMRRHTGTDGPLVCGLDVTPVQAFAFLLAATILFYTMVLSCVIDIGEPRQRRTTDVLFVFACVLATFVWRRTAPGPDRGDGSREAPPQTLEAPPR